jgi:hypothetical protein
MTSAVAIGLNIYLAIIALSSFVWRRYGDAVDLHYVYIVLALSLITIWQLLSADTLEFTEAVQAMNSAVVLVLRLTILGLLIATIFKRGR